LKKTTDVPARQAGRQAGRQPARELNRRASNQTPKPSMKEIKNTFQCQHSKIHQKSVRGDFERVSSDRGDHRPSLQVPSQVVNIPTSWLLSEPLSVRFFSSRELTDGIHTRRQADRHTDGESSPPSVSHLLVSFLRSFYAAAFLSSIFCSRFAFSSNVPKRQAGRLDRSF